MSGSREKKPLSKRLGQALLIIVLLPFIPLGLLAIGIYRASLYLLIWALWLPKGKNVLFVYSDSPIWHDYMTSRILPAVQERAMILNWSERKKWPRWSLAVAGFNHFGGASGFNPLVIWFHPFRRAKVFRYWDAFKDWKRGHCEPVERLTRELLAIV